MIIRLLQTLLNKFISIINNPCVYVAACIGTLIGALTGGAVGFFSGWFITNSYKMSELILDLQNINPAMGVGALIGLLVGGFLGGVFTGLVTIYKIHKRTSPMKILSHENIAGVVLSSLYISIEVAIGMGIGAVIGSLRLPGLGSIMGALVGIMLMFFTASLEKTNK